MLRLAKGNLRFQESQRWMGSHQRRKAASLTKLSSPQRLKPLGNLLQKDWIKSCKKLGLHVPSGAGKGSHQAVYKSEDCPPHDSSCLILTIPKKLHNQMQKKQLKMLISYGDVSGRFGEEDVLRSLGL
jgi:hypothetical protein